MAISCVCRPDVLKNPKPANDLKYLVSRYSDIRWPRRVPARQDFFRVEPVSNINDGFNKLAREEENTCVAVLQPGETLAGTVRFRVTKA